MNTAKILSPLPPFEGKKDDTIREIKKQEERRRKVS